MPLQYRSLCSVLVAASLLATCLPTRPNRPATPASLTRPAPAPELPTTIPTSLPAACLASAQAGAWPAQPGPDDRAATVSAACLDSPSREDLLQVLFTVWLSHFLSGSIPAQYRLQAFSLLSFDKIGEIANLPGSDFGAVVTYSVLPAPQEAGAPVSWWVAGDGRVEENGWIRAKQADVWVARLGDTYQMRLAPHGAG